MKTAITGTLAIIMAGVGTPALANDIGTPMTIGDGVTLDPILDARLRYENVSLDSAAVKDADAVTLRVRAGAELKVRHLSFLVEGEGTWAMGNNYNAFPFPAEHQNRPQYGMVADPENYELNRAQIMWSDGGSSITLGRQRINLDDQRFVGSVGWRQNEQTFDAVRGQTKIGKLSLDATYAINQRTIFGVDAGGRQGYDGSFYFLGAGYDFGPVKVKGFSYLLDYKDPLFVANSSKTFGILATGAIPAGPDTKINFKASYASQSDWRATAKDYKADYLALEAGASYKGFSLLGGYELLGSDSGFGFATPMATLHKFNGWADVFLNTPGSGLEDLYGTLSYGAPKGKLMGLNASVTYHDFKSDKGSIKFGTELDAQIGVKLGMVGLLAKYAHYNASKDPLNTTVDVDKFWLQAEVSF